MQYYASLHYNSYDHLFGQEAGKALHRIKSIRCFLWFSFLNYLSCNLCLSNKQSLTISINSVNDRQDQTLVTSMCFWCKYAMLNLIQKVFYFFLYIWFLYHLQKFCSFVRLLSQLNGLNTADVIWNTNQSINHWGF